MKHSKTTQYIVLSIVLISTQLGSLVYQLFGIQELSWIMIVMQSTGLFLSLITVFFALIQIRSYKRQFLIIKTTITNAIKGNLYIEPSIKSKLKKTNEVDSILLSLFELLHIFQDIIILLKDATKGLSASVDDAKLADDSFNSSLIRQKDYSQNLDLTVRKMTDNMTNIENASANNYATLISVSESIKVLSEHINESEENSNLSKKLTFGISDKIQKGNKALEEMANVIENIAISSGKIEGMVIVIKEISERVNLLALNASIEAARAGEYGSGFAVVAQEVSKLATQTSNSIKEIDNNVKRNKEEVTLNRQKINETNQLYKEIISEVKQIFEKIDFISESATNQSQIKEKLISESEQLSQMLAEIKENIADQNNSQKLISDVAQAMDSSVKATFSEGENLSKLLEKIKSTTDDIGGVILLFK
ncbi:methyl-accepting chemotaxis protein signaling domain protein [Leptospira wolbachii serovar Codice str. CDC]|uniref:Methyl-accepting chemotaxis protein signaling domain protein n=1 Tax=Leptospira wolbachii serovar Codice str. CDC TaxID=1218599 RepID=R9A8G6_9LEPT|nr:methyl-accepting chemotaxis protein [Leptospira wolbachii]EOQ98329.1 methyl-accepting chemotaxis protein signaling domain protein [Leptospira wolbachii serovar Codice str. CDC]